MPAISGRFRAKAERPADSARRRRLVVVAPVRRVGGDDLLAEVDPLDFDPVTNEVDIGTGTWRSFDNPQIVQFPQTTEPPVEPDPDPDPDTTTSPIQP